jgi:hypothetical protein
LSRFYRQIRFFEPLAQGCLLPFILKPLSEIEVLLNQFSLPHNRKSAASISGLGSASPTHLKYLEPWSLRVHPARSIIVMMAILFILGMFHLEHF